MTTILIVDDSDIDRVVLKNILASYYNIIEANNGYQALEILNNPSVHLDGLMLDISMPGLDGFGVLGLMNKALHYGMPILMISAESQKNNILKAANYGVTGFIKKPFDPTQILAKLKSLYSAKAPGMVPSSQPAPQAASQQPQGQQFIPANTSTITDKDVKATATYAQKLRRVYLTYLKSIKKDESLYIHVSEVVNIMLQSYFAAKAPRDLTPEGIEIISQAAYFYDIGMCVVRDEKRGKTYNISEIDEIPETHTIAGADLVGVNSSTSVSYFVKIAADICMHHHERYDGRGMPHGLLSSKNSIYTQMCSIAIEFCKNFFTDDDNYSHGKFNLAINTIEEDKEAFRPDVLELLKNCGDDIVQYYSKLKR